MRRLILTLLVIGAIVFGACTQATPPSSITPPPTPTSPGAVPTTPTTTPAPVGTVPQLQVHFIDVGQGDAILIDYGTAEVLIDGGDRSPGVVPYLQKYVDGDLEIMVATHPHADHVGGLIDVLQAFQVDKIYWNGETSTSKTYSDFMAQAQAEPGASLQQAKRGNTISVNSSLEFAVLNPPSTLFKDINNNSIVLELKYGDVSFLFTGDAENEAETSMLAAGLNVDTDILKVGHHGSRSSSSVSFLRAVSPQIAVYMAGGGNSYGHPHGETIAALNDVGAKVYGTDIHGTVIVASDGQKYTLKLGKDAQPRAPPAIATFTTKDLSITPTEVNAGESLTISVVVSNTGGVTGTYPVTLKVNNVAAETKNVTLASGASQKVTFTTSKDAAGTYTVGIDGLSGMFKVKAASATFTVSDLTVSPTEVDIGQSVTININVTNTGGVTGTYPVTLKVNNVAAETKNVTLASGASQKVTFTTSKDAAGTYTVGIDGLSGMFKVKAASATFTVSDLTVSPTEVDIGQSVTININVTNTGDLTGTYEIILKIDNTMVSSQQITLAGHATQKVTFTTSKDAAGVYTVNVSGLSGTFSVKSPSTSELTLTIVSVTSPVGPGYNATLIAKTAPGARCTITVYYKSGPSEAAGLYPKDADANGSVSWTWKVGTRTTPGSWRIVVTASLSGKTVSQTTYFTVQ